MAPSCAFGASDRPRAAPDAPERDDVPGGPGFPRQPVPCRSYDALQATIVSQTYTFASRARGSQRPDGSNNLSFPSGHTSNAFAWAAVANHYYGKKAGIAAFAVAGLIGLSRIDNNKHNVTDVVAGATLGYIVGRTTVRKDGEPVRRQTRISLTPSFAASGGGVGVGVSVQF